MSKEKIVKDVLDFYSFAAESQLVNFVLNLQTAAELKFALCDEQMLNLGIPHEAIFHRPDLHIKFQMSKPGIKA